MPYTTMLDLAPIFAGELPSDNLVTENHTVAITNALVKLRALEDAYRLRAKNEHAWSS